MSDPELQDYKSKYFINPGHVPRFNFHGIRGAALYYQDYPGALAFFRKVFGEPGYVEGEFTHGWRIGDTWLTVFPAGEGAPQNVEVMLYLKTPEEVDRLYDTMLEAGAQGEQPVDSLMYTRVRMAVVQDPFGGMFSIICEMG